ncbi:pyridoxal phosphate-dependent aminotransferase [Rarobacter incanus]|uniref:Aminotransferase n=1 Tax=Rarobacter incanus TaxID=153494 RepID=A0A542SPT0_9MICO|nr:aminotransferase class I/II-fold pyridoxal phosphate-dependent enzyme [Rarobacter incanus]TQK76565.1 aspartate/methionine/tyrosine aminotransferase [Rarobacter incanus]
MKVAKRARVPSFSVMDIVAEAASRRASGQDIVSLCVGEPVSGASEVVRARAQQLLASGDLGYTDPLGALALRSEIAGHYRRWYDAHVDPAQIAVTTGSSGAFMVAFLAAFDAGDVVAVARPGYPAYRNILNALGCEVLDIACGPDHDFRLTTDLLDAALRGRGRMDGLVVASPANPTGTMLDAAEVAAITSWCENHGVRLISDEIYHGIVYDPARWPGASAVEAVGGGAIVINSFSKYWAMTGWRLGWMILPPDLVTAADALTSNIALCPPSLAQFAAVAAFSDEGYGAAQREVERYARTREIMLEALPSIGWKRVAPPDGAFYLYADISDVADDATQYCRDVLDRTGVALAPGGDFDPVDGGKHVRVSLAAGENRVAEALSRLRER